MFVRSLLFPLTLSFAFGARAEPVIHRPGEVVLPMTGLAVDLPKDKRKGHQWSLTSSFSLDEGFDARDVIDEKVGDRFVSATWVSVGYFSAGECRAVLDEVSLEEGETSTPTLFDRTWTARTGRYDFGEPLGKAPMVALCGTREDRKAVLIYHFLLDPSKPPTLETAAIIKAASGHALLASVARSWESDRFIEKPPLGRKEVRNRGTLDPSREVLLPVSGLTLKLPEDGYIWVPRPPEPGASADVDWVDRLAPALPEMSFELVKVPDANCKDFFASIDAPRFDDRPPKDVPKGWMAGPVLAIDGHPEHTICRDLSNAALVVGLYTAPEKGPSAGSFKPMHALLEAILKAAAK
jgi:hypothetical protein